MRSFLLSVWLCLLQNLAFTTATGSTEPSPPSIDAFYEQPSNISLFRPGQVIRSRRVANKYNGLGPDGQPFTVNVQPDSWQFLYRTTDSLGHAVAAGMTMFIPSGNYSDGTRLLSYQVAEDAANGDCAPSYGFRNGSTLSEGSDQVLIGAALNQGWYVISPDYEGLKGQYVPGLQAGRATLDGVRAALDEGSRHHGLSRQARYAMWGYSGGSLATEWACELQPGYAPELKFAGAAFGGVTPNVTSVLLTLNDSPYSGDAFAGTRGITNAFPDFASYVDKHLLPDKRDEFYNISGGCLDYTGAAAANKDLFAYLDNGRGILSDPLPRGILDHNTQQGLRATPPMPMFVYKAVNDQYSPVGDTDWLVRRYCERGAAIEYQRNANGEHLADFALGGAFAFQWLVERLDGKPLNTSGKGSGYSMSNTSSIETSVLSRCRTTNVALTTDDIDKFPVLGEQVIRLMKLFVETSPPVQGVNPTMV